MPIWRYTYDAAFDDYIVSSLNRKFMPVLRATDAELECPADGEQAFRLAQY